MSLNILSDLPWIMLPLLLASIGALYTDRIGILNVGIEGLISIGAFIACIMAGTTQNIFLSILIATLSTALFALIIPKAKQLFGSDPFIVALALNMLIQGLTGTFAQVLFNTKGVVRFKDFPSLIIYYENVSKGKATMYDFLLSLLSPFALFAIAIFAAFLLEKSSLGLRLKALGSNKASFDSSGLNPSKYENHAFFISGLLSGLAGAALALPLGAFVPNSSSGRGWIALVLVYIGGRNSVGVTLAALVFTSLSLFANLFQATQFLPQEIVIVLPSMIALIIYSINRFLTLKKS